MTAKEAITLYVSALRTKKDFHMSAEEIIRIQGDDWTGKEKEELKRHILLADIANIIYPKN